MTARTLEKVNQVTVLKSFKLTL